LIFDSSPQDFYQVYLIIPETKLSIYEKYDETVGLITFDSKSDNLFTLNRNASINRNRYSGNAKGISFTNARPWWLVIAISLGLVPLLFNEIVKIFIRARIKSANV